MGLLIEIAGFFVVGILILGALLEIMQMAVRFAAGVVGTFAALVSRVVDGLFKLLQVSLPYIITGCVALCALFLTASLIPGCESPLFGADSAEDGLWSLARTPGEKLFVAGLALALGVLWILWRKFEPLLDAWIEECVRRIRNRE